MQVESWGERKEPLEAGTVRTCSNGTSHGKATDPHRGPLPAATHGSSLHHVFVSKTWGWERKERKQFFFLIGLALLALGGIKASGVEHSP